MVAFLFTIGFAALLVVGGTMVSLHLRTHRVAAGRRLSGLRRAYAAPMGYTTAVNRRVAEDGSSHYARRAFVTSILLLVMLSVILIGVINAVIH
jgi:hypothetical protein